MNRTIVPRERVAENLAVPTRVLIRYEARGLIRAERAGDVEGYAPAEVRRLWSILSYQRDLGINLAGVEAILKLRDHLAEVHHHLDHVARQLREALDGDGDAPADDDA